MPTAVVRRTLRPLAPLLGLTLAFAAAALPGCGDGGSEGRTRLKIASPLPEDHPATRALAEFAEDLTARTDGRVRATLFANAALGNATEALESVRAGSNVEIAAVAASEISQYDPMFNVLAMPFLFEDMDHMHRVLDGEVGAEFARRLRDQGLHLLAYFDAGTRNIMTMTGPVQRPEDLSGRTIRVMTAKVLIDTINSLGASAKPMPQGDVYTALRLGNIDGWENNASTAFQFRMHETGCDHFAWTHHLAIPDLIVMNAALYDRLPEDLRAELDAAAAEMLARQRRLWAEAEAAAVASLQREGVKFNEVDLAAFRERAAPVYERQIRQHGELFESLVERIRREAAR